ncbi:hypothetical protein SAMN05444169_0067 [Bradyrhizobium erythrophlei]|uniref:Uncharacterized protein n=1 Tax=Bradyrhizobium erythrophlei TaxID=1437360 RepID=A0A1M5GDT4_9BRAD|nr:hypothetical protein SAMN05444169_0067 [Bradyrhizobium erythrophlei]
MPLQSYALVKMHPVKIQIQMLNECAAGWETAAASPTGAWTAAQETEPVLSGRRGCAYLMPAAAKPAFTAATRISICVCGRLRNSDRVASTTARRLSAKVDWRESCWVSAM